MAPCPGCLPLQAYINLDKALRDRIYAGEVPEDWEEHSHKLSQKDTQARWTKKHNRSYYGYKNHVDIDNQHKLIRRYNATDASLHDSQVLGELIDPYNTGADV
ncbi:transposase [Pseudomonadota bacterium]